MTELRTESSERFGETFHRVTYPSGLRLWFLPRPGFTKKVAILAVHFGSVHENGPPGGPEPPLPPGTAHFLEHRLFETEEGDAFDRFERMGASANAGTGHTNTTYFFTCTERFYEALDLLVGFLDRLVLTDEMVDNERRIIVQEILSYRDVPDWQGFLGLLESLYPTHPVRHDISGTPDTVAAIDRAVLERAYRTFYTPANADLVVSGDLDPEELAGFVERRLPPRAAPPPRPALPREERPVGPRHVRRFLAVPRPRFFLGFRDRAGGLEGRDLFRRNIATNLFLYALFGQTSDFYRRHYHDGLIDETFSSSFRGERPFAYSVLSAETDRPAELRDQILRAVGEARRRGLPREDLARAVRRMKGRFYKAFNSPEASAFSLLAYALRGVSLFSFGPVLDSLSPDDIDERLRDHCRADRHALCVVDPLPAGKRP